VTAPEWVEAVKRVTEALDALEDGAEVLRRGEAIQPGSDVANAILEATK
jgi:hypothetical protein